MRTRTLTVSACLVVCAAFAACGGRSEMLLYELDGGADDSGSPDAGSGGSSSGTSSSSGSSSGTSSSSGEGSSSSGSSSGASSSSGSSSGTSSSSGSGGGSCVAECTTDVQCQNSCPAIVGGGANCCDLGSGVCYATAMSACPGVVDAGPE